MRLLKRLRRLPTSKAVVVSFVVLALSMAMIGCDSSGTNSTSAPAASTPTATTTTTTPDTTDTIQATDLRGSVSGKVVDSATGQPIVGATVSAGVGVTPAKTDTLGNFLLTNVLRTETNTPIILTVTGATGGTLGLGTNYPALSNAVVAIRSKNVGGANPSVEDTQVISGIEIELHDQSGFITGTLLDTNQKPFGGAVVTVKPVEIPVITPGVADGSPSTGVFPFALPIQTTTTTDSSGKFTLANLPVNWTYDITIIPGLGIPNLLFTNQYLPSASGNVGRLAFPDTVGAPADSAVANALDLAGFVTGAVGAAAGCQVPVTGGFVGCGALTPGAPLVIGKPQADTIPPFVLSTSDLFDNAIYTDTGNTPAKVFRIRFSEPLLQSVDLLQSSIRLVYRGSPPPAPLTLANEVNGQIIPTTITLEDGGATLVLTAALAAGQRLAPGGYSVIGLLNLSDTAGNRYTGAQPAGLAACFPGNLAGCTASSPPGAALNVIGDAASKVDVTADTFPDADGVITFTILEPEGPGAQVAAVTNIVCSPGSCNNMVPFFTATFGPAANAVQYFGGFATGQAPNIPLIPTVGFDASGDGVLQPGELFASAGPLLDPPEFIVFNLVNTTVMGITNGVGVPIPLQGFQFPLVPGTESNAQIPNNYFDDNVSYIVEVEGQNMAGLRGPQVISTTIKDNTAPGLNTMSAAPGVQSSPFGNDFSARLDATVLAGMGAILVPPASMINLTTPFTFLDNLYSNVALTADTMGDSIPFVEGPPVAPPGAATPGGTVGYDFTTVATSTMEGFAGPDIFYSAADYTMQALLIPNSAITIGANEDLDATAMLTIPTLTPVSNPANLLSGLFTATGANLPSLALAAAAVNSGLTGTITGVTIPNDTDVLKDENLIRLTFADPRNFATGDLVAFTGSGITDEAGTALTASVRIANGIPAAITSAVATATAASHILTLNFDRPVVFDSGATMGTAPVTLVAPLGLRNADLTPLTSTLVGGTVVQAANLRSLTITVPFDASMGIMGLGDLTLNTVIDGAGAAIGAPGLSTDDALAFLGPTGNQFVANMGGTPFLGVNTFRVADGVANGRAALLITDQIPPGIATGTGAPAPIPGCAVAIATGVPLVLNADCTALNTAVAAVPGEWQTGKATALEAYVVLLAFSEPVFAGTTPADILASARAKLSGFTVTMDAASTAVYAVNADTMVSIPAAPTSSTVVLSFVLNSGVVGAMDELVIPASLTDLAGNLINPAFDEVVLGAPSGGATLK